MMAEGSGWARIPRPAGSGIVLYSVFGGARVDIHPVLN